jgi:cytochrome c oxidase subunit 3
MSARGPAPEDVRSRPVPLDTGRLGMRILLLSLSMLFAASLAGMVVVRSHAAAWPPAGTPSLPGGLWLSTLLILASSATIAWALRGIGRGDAAVLKIGLGATLLLGVGFLISQTFNWFVLVAENVTPRLNLFAFTFYLLTVLHALHVVGGLVPLGVVTGRAWRGVYSSDFHPGVRYVATYWHFLDVIWLVLFTVLFLL